MSLPEESFKQFLYLAMKLLSLPKFGVTSQTKLYILLRLEIVVIPWVEICSSLPSNESNGNCYCDVENIKIELVWMARTLIIESPVKAAEYRLFTDNHRHSKYDQQHY